MDLVALQADCVAFDAAVGSTQDALAVQDRQLSALTAAWQGEGADASRDFLGRHSDVSRAAAAAIRTAAEALSALRENLWGGSRCEGSDRGVDRRRRGGASCGVAGRCQDGDDGCGDRAAAAELVDQAVKPLVQQHSHGVDHRDAHGHGLGDRRLPARGRRDLGRTRADVRGAGSLGPAWSAPTAGVCEEEVRCPEPAAAPAAAATSAGMPAGTGTPAATAPAAWSAPPSSPPPAPLSAPAPSVGAPAMPPVPAPAQPVAPAAPPMPSLGGMGSGCPTWAADYRGSDKLPKPWAGCWAARSVDCPSRRTRRPAGGPRGSRRKRWRWR